MKFFSLFFTFCFVPDCAFSSLLSPAYYTLMQVCPYFPCLPSVSVSQKIILHFYVDFCYINQCFSPVFIHTLPCVSIYRLRKETKYGPEPAGSGPYIQYMEYLQGHSLPHLVETEDHSVTRTAAVSRSPSTGSRKCTYMPVLGLTHFPPLECLAMTFSPS